MPLIGKEALDLIGRSGKACHQWRSKFLHRRLRLTGMDTMSTLTSRAWPSCYLPGHEWLTFTRSRPFRSP